MSAPAVMMDVDAPQPLSFSLLSLPLDVLLVILQHSSSARASSAASSRPAARCTASSMMKFGAQSFCSTGAPLRCVSR